MSDASFEVPLLPLPAVLFPGTFLPVQVSAEMHRTLVRDCLGDGKHVGVILTANDNLTARKNIPASTGCLASLAVLSEPEDADSDTPVNAVLFGERRIRVVDFLSHDPYLIGKIILLDDHDDKAARLHIDEVTSLFHQYLDLISASSGGNAVEFSLPQEPTLASYLLASVLYLPLAVKQRWLESASTMHRLEEELTFLRAECRRHEAILALSRLMGHRYSLPDPKLYLSLTTPN